MNSTLTGVCLALALTVGGQCALPSWAAAGDPVVVDRHTGLALYGFDPVAYFTDARPAMGRAEFEYAFGGAIWRFRNEGNREAFSSNPDIYMPRYGGYDPIAVGRGIAISGHPDFWLIAENRLYLFANKASREAFAAGPQQAGAAADESWPQVPRSLP